VFDTSLYILIPIPHTTSVFYIDRIGLFSYVLSYLLLIKISFFRVTYDLKDTLS